MKNHFDKHGINNLSRTQQVDTVDRVSSNLLLRRQPAKIRRSTSTDPWRWVAKIDMDVISHCAIKNQYSIKIGKIYI